MGVCIAQIETYIWAMDPISLRNGDAPNPPLSWPYMLYKWVVTRRKNQGTCTRSEICGTGIRTYLTFDLGLLDTRRPVSRIRRPKLNQLKVKLQGVQVVAALKPLGTDRHRRRET